MRVPLLSGVVSSPAAEFIQTFPLNLEPVAIDSKISKGQFKPPPGAVQTAIGDGRDRGSIIWNNRHYRVLGELFYEVASDGSLVEIGSVGGSDVGVLRCNMSYSFDRLIIPSGGDIFYYDGIELTKLTDPDLARSIDAIWIDGYTMSTDGTYVVVTELSDPTQVKPLKYGSAETDPDPITGLLRYRDEAYVFGRHTVQTFRNVGGNGFPFSTVRGGTIPYGCVSPGAKCLFGDGFAFVGSARSEALNIFIGGQGNAQPFGNRAVCDALAAAENPAEIEVEARIYGGEQRLFIHLPTESWCFLANASQAFGEPVWFRLKTSEDRPYRLRNMIEIFGKRWVGDSSSGRVGYLDEGVWGHWNVGPEWQFEAGMLYNQGKGAIVHSAELIGLPGRGGKGSVFMSMTRDGETWTPERAITIEPGERTKRIQWRPHARIGNYMGFRFRGTGTALPGFAALEVNAQGLGQ